MSILLAINKSNGEPSYSQFASIRKAASVSIARLIQNIKKRNNNQILRWTLCKVELISFRIGMSDNTKQPKFIYTDERPSDRTKEKTIFCSLLKQYHCEYTSYCAIHWQVICVLLTISTIILWIYELKHFQCNV